MSRMKNPAHPGELVAAMIEDAGWSVKDTAEALGVSRQQLHNIIATKSRVETEMAVRLAKAFGGTADTWLRMQMNFDLAQIRGKTIEVRRIEPKVA